ncbi:MAG: thermonuclease family protein [Roseovarius sp.]
MTPTSFVYVLLTVVALYQIAQWLAPYNALAEQGCILGYVYDGDTVELKCGAERLTARLQGFDTAETKDPRCAEELAHGALATDRLRALVKQGEVTFSQRGYDKYNRVLIRLSVDGVDVGETLVREGLAVPYTGGKRIDWCARLEGA